MIVHVILVNVYIMICLVLTTLNKRNVKLVAWSIDALLTLLNLYEKKIKLLIVNLFLKQNITKTI